MNTENSQNHMTFSGDDETKNTTILQESDDYIAIWIDNFMFAKRSKAAHTIRFYRTNLDRFLEYCNSREVKAIQHFTPQFFREFFYSLEQKGLNLGGQAVYYRTLRSWLRWYEEELDIETNHYSKMLAKAKPQSPHPEVLDAVTPEQVRKLLDTCETSGFIGIRDRLIISLLFDTGVRSQELCDLQVDDVIPQYQRIIIRHGKGNKKRTVFYGDLTRKLLRRFERVRKPNVIWLLHNRTGEKLEYQSLREITRRACRRAGIDNIPLHAFRRGFSTGLLRKKVDLHTIQMLLGHANLSVINRYLKQSDLDIQNNYESNMDDLQSD